ncbi:MAG: HAMP domain-containing histidine kinase [Bacteroidales bacterium]|nr:HAMP domain-containing histidine kinase [Bacteroidales bacterium]
MARRMALNQINKQLLEFEKIKSKFLQIISHEIRTPLNGIVGSVNLLKDVITSEEIRTILEMLDTSVSRLETFSITALKITELQSHKYNLKKEEINLAKEIESQLTDLSGKIHDRGVRVNRSNIPEYVSINANLNLVRICLKNILDNAVKYCTENGEIEIRVHVENQSVTCEIIDDGVGFSKQTLNNLFTLFSIAGEHVDNSPGLVFPLLKLIMEAHEGRIEVKNAKNGGAIVQLMFPIDPVK